MPRRNATAISTLAWNGRRVPSWHRRRGIRSEEHTSELQSHSDLVCRLLLEKKKKGHSDDLQAIYKWRHQSKLQQYLQLYQQTQNTSLKSLGPHNEVDTLLPCNQTSDYIRG